MLDEGALRTAASLIAAATAIAELVRRVDMPSRDWSSPGPGAWDLRGLVGHTCRALSTVLDYLEHPAEREDVASAAECFASAAASGSDLEAVLERGRQAGRELGQHPANGVERLVAEVVGRIGRAAPETLITVRGGGMRLDRYLETRVFELVVHGLDVGAATGLTLRYPSEVLADAAALAARIAAATGAAPAALAALTGRVCLPEGFSVVP